MAEKGFIGLAILFTFLSWLGEYIHNLLDLPQLTLLSPENSIPALISVALLVAWCLLPSKQLPTLALLIWAFMHLIGGGVLSVLPFPFLPFFSRANTLPLSNAWNLCAGTATFDHSLISDVAPTERI